MRKCIISPIVSFKNPKIDNHSIYNISKPFYTYNKKKPLHKGFYNKLIIFKYLQKPHLTSSIATASITPYAFFTE